MLHNVLSISGGKDSTAMLILAVKERNLENITCVFADTGHESPITVQYIGYLEEALDIEIRRIKANFTIDLQRKRERTIPVKWVKDGIPPDKREEALNICNPTGIPFLDLCLFKGKFPSGARRFCTEELKIKPIQEQVFMPLFERGDNILSWQGIRREESKSRARMEEYEVISERMTIHRPLIDWTYQQVFDIHAKYGVEPNPLYKLGFSRVGCFPCIFCNKSELFNLQARFPEETTRITEWENLVKRSSKYGNSSFFGKTDGRGDNFAEAVEWSKTLRGGRQYDPVKLTYEEEPPTCSSVYGLCE